MKAIEFSVVAFGLLSVGLLAAAAIHDGKQAVMFMALLSAGLGYVSQVCAYLHQEDVMPDLMGPSAFSLWFMSLCAWAAGFFGYLTF